MGKSATRPERGGNLMLQKTGSAPFGVTTWLHCGVTTSCSLGNEPAFFWRTERRLISRNRRKSSP